MNIRVRPLAVISLIIAALILYLLLLLTQFDLNNLLGVNWTNRDVFIASAKQLVPIGTLIIFILLLIVVWIKRLIAPREDITDIPTQGKVASRPRYLIISWIAGVVVALALISGTSVYVNPSDMYGTSFYHPWAVPDRHEKVPLYEALANPPDVVIFGTSRAFEYSPAQITQQTGYSAFNMAFTGGTIQDFTTYTRFILQRDHKLPKVIVMEMMYPIKLDPPYAAEYEPLAMLPYMDATMQRMAIQARVDGLLDTEQFSESLWVARYASLIGQPIAYTIHADGWTVPIGKPGNDQLNDVVNTAIAGLPSQCEPKHNADGEKLVLDYLDQARKYGTTVILVRAPYLDRFYQAMQQKEVGFAACEKAALDYFVALTRQYDNVFFTDFETPGNFPGDETLEGFSDFMHVTVKNAAIEIDLLMPKIQQGYQLALQRQATLPR